MKYVVVDVETTGIPEVDRGGNMDFRNVDIIEVAVMRSGTDMVLSGLVEQYVNGGLGSDFFRSWFVKLPVGKRVPPEATRVNGITDEMLEKDGVAVDSVIDQFSTWVGKSGVIVGHNILFFDIPLLYYCDYCVSSVVFDVALIWKAGCLGMRRHRWESLDCFWGRVYGVRECIKYNLQWLTQVAMGDLEMSDHRAFNNCLRVSIVFNFLWGRGIVQNVLNLDHLVVL